MAQISEEHIIIKVSQLIRDGDSASHLLTDEVIASLEAVAAELVGDGCVVEVATLED